MPYLNNALASLIETIVGLYLIAVILRFLFQLLRVDFRNPLVQAVIIVTNPPLRLLRKFVPGLYGIDLTVVVLIVLVGLIKLALPLLVAGYSFRWGGALVLSMVYSMDTITWVFLIAILARVVLSWVAPRSHHPAAHIVAELSEPLLAPFRRLLPPFGGLDFSPIVALLALRMVQQLALAPLVNLGASLL